MPKTLVDLSGKQVRAMIEKEIASYKRAQTQRPEFAEVSDKKIAELQQAANTLSETK